MRHLLLLVLAFAGCSGTERSQNDRDSGVAADSGADDSGVVADTGVKPDSGSANDSGTAVDSGTESDGGEQQGDSGQVLADGGGDMDGGGPGGACTNPADQAVHDNTDVSAGVETCAGDCFGGSQCTRECIVMDVGLSEDCANCYVDAVTCTIQNCLSVCAGSDSAACAMCRDDNGCTSGFLTCSGFGP